MGIRLFLINSITKLIPPTRFYKTKSFLYQFSGVRIGKTARIVSSVDIWGNGSVSIGENTFIGHNVLIITGKAPISIGNNVDIGPMSILVNGTHHIDMNGMRTAGQGVSYSIKIEDGVWIGASSTILGGTTIGEKSIIAAGSVVNKDIPPFCMAAGVPCKTIKIWDKTLGKWLPV